MSIAQPLLVNVLKSFQPRNAYIILKSDKTNDFYFNNLGTFDTSKLILPIK